jgi:hypothetical protein
MGITFQAESGVENPLKVSLFNALYLSVAVALFILTLQHGLN